MATMGDIAKAVGVSKTTVTNVFSGKANVSMAMRQRIQQYAEEIGYRPNMLARSLAKGKTFMIGLVVRDLDNPFYPEVADAVANFARESNYQTLLCTTGENQELGRQQLERLVSQWVDGCLIMDRTLDLAMIEQYFHQGLPLVLCDWQLQEVPAQIPQVRGDFFRAGVLAAQHLLDLGHRDIAVIVDQPGQILRLQGFCSVLQQAGVSLSDGMLEQGNSTLADGYTATKRLLARPTHPTAIFASTDMMAIGALDALIDEGLRVPQDVSLIGLDNIIVSSYIRPTLTSIAIPKDQLARESLTLLFEQIQKTVKPDAPKLHLVEPRLVVRQSTAGPKLP